STTVTSALVAGAEMRTFLTLPRRCACARVASVNLPVDSTTTWTSSPGQSIAAGSGVAKTLMDCVPMRRVSPSARTSWAQGPSVESYCNRCARVCVFVRSFSATNSMAGWLRPARRTFLPMRPKPLIPTLIAIRNFSLHVVIRNQRGQPYGCPSMGSGGQGPHTRLLPRYCDGMLRARHGVHRWHGWAASEADQSLPPISVLRLLGAPYP